MTDRWEGIRDRLLTIELYGITAEQEDYLSDKVADMVRDLCNALRVDWSMACGPGYGEE